MRHDVLQSSIGLKVRGACLCGSIQYEFENEPFDCCYCHCSICRKLTGSACGSYGSVKKEDFSWLAGAEQRAVFKPTKATTRYFCSNCGSFLLTEHSAEPENLFVSLGTIDTEFQSAPRYHQFVAHAACWDTIEDDLMKYADWPGDVC